MEVAVTADEAQPAFGAVGLHLPWQAYAIIAFVLVMALVIAVVTNAYPGITQLSAASVPLVTVTGKFVAGWMGTLVNFGAVVSAFGASATSRKTPSPRCPRPFNWDVLAAGITLAAGIVLPFVYPPLRRGIASSPLLRAGASALLGSRAASDQ